MKRRAPAAEKVECLICARRIHSGPHMEVRMLSHMLENHPLEFFTNDKVMVVTRDFLTLIESAGAALADRIMKVKGKGG